jgi:hypothetical protein
MALRKYEQRLASQLSSELGEPILRCIALNAATMHDRMRLDTFTPLWRPSLIVNGQPQTRLPQTMFLIHTDANSDYRHRPRHDRLPADRVADTHPCPRRCRNNDRPGR